MPSKSEIAKGVKIESEHQDTYKALIADVKAGRVKPLEHYQKLTVGDHTEEFDNYYSELIKMEKKLEKESFVQEDLSVLKAFNSDENLERGVEKTAELDEASEAFFQDLGIIKKAEEKTSLDKLKEAISKE